MRVTPSFRRISRTEDLSCVAGEPIRLPVRVLRCLALIAFFTVCVVIANSSSCIIGIGVKKDKYNYMQKRMSTQQWPGQVILIDDPKPTSGRVKVRRKQNHVHPT